MKNILKTIILFAFLSCQAQQNYDITYNGNDFILKNNNHLKDYTGVLNKFVGDWKWISPSNPNTYFIVNFFKAEDYNPSNDNGYYSDKIVGNYRYVENGVEKINTLNFTNFNDMYSNQFPAILSTLINNSPFKLLSITMSDKLKGKTCDANFEITDANNTTATWKMYDHEHWNMNGTNPLPQGFSIPSDVVLIKQ